MADKQFVADSAALLDIYKRAALLKANDERARKVILSGQVAMVYYSYRGQEIIPSVMGNVLRDDDTICTIYRGIHDMLGKGFPLKELWAELAGRSTGSCKGKGGPMHLTYPPKGIMVTTGIVGSSAPIANGLAWAAQLDKSDRVSVCTFGDGASNIGAVHEAMNLASVWKLPTIFVCQNNLFAEHTAFEKMTGGQNIANRAEGYGMPGVRVDGNDPEAMYSAFSEAVARARAGARGAHVRSRGTGALDGERPEGGQCRAQGIWRRGHPDPAVQRPAHRRGREQRLRKRPADLPVVLAQRLRRVHLRHPGWPLLVPARRHQVLTGSRITA